MSDTTHMHVVPVNDLREHDSAPTCWCRPIKDEGLWLHNAMDERDLVEQGKRRIQ